MSPHLLPAADKVLRGGEAFSACRNSIDYAVMENCRPGKAW
jgi:hypothetical protein